MGSESADFEEVQATILAELERKRQHYRTKAGRTLLLFIAAGAFFGLSRGQFMLKLVGATIVGGLWAGYYWWQYGKDPRSSPILELLRTRHTDIVWIYSRAEHRQESAAVILGLMDGTRQEVPVVEDRREWMISTIARRAPWATVGFHHEHERKYFDNPASLRRDAPGGPV